VLLSKCLCEHIQSTLFKVLSETQPDTLEMDNIFRCPLVKWDDSISLSVWED